MRYTLNENYQLEEKGDGFLLTNKDNTTREFLLDRHCALVYKNIREGISENYNRPISNLMFKSIIKIFKKLEIIKEETNSKGKVDTINDVLKISIVILNYNGQDHLRECLDSISNQSYKNYEIIIVDNASKDNSIEILKKYYKDNIKLIELKKGVSFSKGNNLGIKRAKAPYVLVINNDTKLDPRALEELRICIRKNKDKKWSAIALKMRFFHQPQIINSLGNSLQKKNWGYDNFLGFIDFGQFDKIGEVMSACFGAVLINKYAYQTVGDLDSSYWFYYEDVDWCFRSQLAGYRILTCPNAIVYHKFSASSSQRKGELFKIKLAIRNRMYFAFKNLKLFFLWKFFINYFKEDLINFFVSITRKKFDMTMAYVKAYLELTIIIPLALIKRMEITKIKRKNNPSEHEILNRAQGHFPPILFMKKNFIKLNVNLIRTFYLKNLMRDQMSRNK